MFAFMVHRRKRKDSLSLTASGGGFLSSIPQGKEKCAKSRRFSYEEAGFAPHRPANVALKALLRGARPAKPGRAAGWERGGRGIMRPKEFRRTVSSMSCPYHVLYHPLIRSLAASTISQPC